MKNNSYTQLFDNLNEDEKIVIEYVCFCFRAISVTSLYNVFTKAGVSRESGPKFTSQQIRDILLKTQNLELVVVQSPSSYVVRKDCRNHVLESLFARNKSLNLFVESFRVVYSLNANYFNSYWITNDMLISIYSLLNQAVLTGNQSFVNEQIERLNRLHVSRSINTPFIQIMSSNCMLIARAIRFDCISMLEERSISKAINDIVLFQFVNSADTGQVVEALNKSDKPFNEFQNIKLSYSFFSCDFNYVEKNGINTDYYWYSQFLKGVDISDKLKLLLAEQAIDFGSKQEFVYAGMLALIQIPQLLSQDKTKVSKVKSFIKNNSEIADYYPLGILCSCFSHMGKPNAAYLYKNEYRNNEIIISSNKFHFLLYSIGLYWLKADVNDLNELELCKIANNYQEKNNVYLEYETNNLLALVFKRNQYVERIETLKKQYGIVRCISDLYVPPSDWDLKLSMLSEFASKTKKKPTEATDERIVWLFDDKDHSIQPVLQKAQKNGTWTAGRNVALQKLKEMQVSCITEHDKKVIDNLKIYKDYYGTSYNWGENTLASLVGHPHIYNMKAPTVPIELEIEDIELIVEEKNGMCIFSFSESLFNRSTLVKQGTNKYKILHASEDLKQISEIIGEKLSVPLNAKPKVLETLKQLSSSIKINSPLVGEQTGAKRVEASLNLYIHLLPLGNGIKADLFVKPLDPEPPYLRPAEGLKKITGHSGDLHIWTERNFPAEQKSVELLMERCPVFASQAMSDFSASFDDPTECLQVLSEFKDAIDLATVEWPRGQKIAIKSKLSIDNFSLRLKKQNNWFDLQGDVAIDDEQVISLVKMMQLLDTAKNRFVEIEPGVFIELEKHFIRQLEYLKTVADVNTKLIKLHPLAAVSNAGLFDSVGSFTADKEWSSFIKKVKKTEKTEYSLPKGIEAELRPYQEEGYRWLRKMADWGTGACLADDMGLGKTLQCIALLVSRMSEGPSLVIAPTSVCRNWIAEIEKFAPALQPILFGMYDRKSTIETIESGGVLIVSYGLLASEAELLASKKWNVYILDEAHAIKNIATKRSQVAMSIEAQFRVAATGTPLQNHMGELWNLFQFLNPGLLGSQQWFNERYVIPIEKSNNELARRALKDLIKPFILRRTKNQVLHDLPEKTEITLSIDLSTEERTFYEALRVKALAEIQKLDNTTNSGEKQMRVLAEIMKLRMACCHSSLANKEINLESSKLKRLEELVEHLIENGHKALIFSQFIGHISLIREMLERKTISYEYLDGSTSPKEREERIKRFQQGSADLFLISLKAGGVGLNLTAADYVIHTDPWWNPAVEDQASDRAHRIGQTKPVTIYRLVTKDTIEDKIVDLHKNKRDLADSLLEGTESAAKITADELVNLLKTF
ncbi:MAG: DEAD/DEAH box helicase [Bacteroidales bacterium]|nr:DEAD/DEAH box helicase [Bacteroidales bacterium]